MSSPPAAAPHATKHAAAAPDCDARAPHTPPPLDTPSRVTLGRPIVSPAAWTAAEARAAPDEWQDRLTQGDADELVAAARAVVAAGKDVTVSRRVAAWVFVSTCLGWGGGGERGGNAGWSACGRSAREGAPLSKRVQRRLGFLMPPLAQLLHPVRPPQKNILPLPSSHQSLTLADFPLPTLGPRLAAIADAVVRTGRGFYLLRGFPVDDLSRAELIAAWYGVGLHWGTPVSQNARGHVVGHVKRIDGAEERSADDRIYRTSHSQPWHVDDADLVGLLCVRPAAGGGGLSRWASSLSVYNRLLATRPDVIATLQQPFPFDRRGEVAPGQQPYVEVPLLTVHDGALTFFFNDLHVRSSQRHPGAPRLTPEQEDALRAVVEAASDPELHLEWDLQRGDVQVRRRRECADDGGG